MFENTESLWPTNSPTWLRILWTSSQPLVLTWLRSLLRSPGPSLQRGPRRELRSSCLQLDDAGLEGVNQAAESDRPRSATNCTAFSVAPNLSVLICNCRNDTCLAGVDRWGDASKVCARKCSLNVSWKTSTVWYHLYVKSEKAKPIKNRVKRVTSGWGGWSGEIRALMFKGKLVTTST